LSLDPKPSSNRATPIPFKSLQALGILYLDGQRQGQISPRIQTFTWDPAKTSINAGLSYIGLWDELSVFNRALTADQVRSLTTLRVAELIK